MKRFILGILALLFSFLMVTGAHAAGIDSPVAVDNIDNIVGVGVGIVPTYLGSVHYQVAGAPFFKFSFGENMYLQLTATDLHLNVLNHPWLQFGPAVNYRPERSDNTDNNQVDRMHKIDGTVEAGAFLGVQLKAANPRQRFLASIEFLDDVGDVYGGYVFTLSARYWYPVMEPLDVTLGFSTTWADKNYMNNYFGVNPGNRGSSTLPFFTASSGMRDWSFSPGAVWHFSKEWHVAVGAIYRRLVGDAKNSPLVDGPGQSIPGTGIAIAGSPAIGSPDQLFAGVGVAYAW